MSAKEDSTSDRRIRNSGLYPAETSLIDEKIDPFFPFLAYRGMRGDMRSTLRSRLVRWALGSHLLATMVAFSRWLLASLAAPQNDHAEWRMWRALLRYDALHQKGLRHVRRVAEAERSLCRYRRLLRWLFDSQRQPVQLHAAA